MEEWKPIKDYEGLYEISNLGRVRSLDRERVSQNGKKYIHKGRILKIRKDSNGYCSVCLYNKNKCKKYARVHRLVAEAFIPNPENKPNVDHINTIKTKNEVWNLRWVTQKENNNNELTRSHMSESSKGFVVSEEHRKRVSECNKGENNPMYGKRGSEAPTSKKVVQLTLDDELVKIWDCMLEAERQEGFTSQCISHCCKGKRKTHRGYKWVYYEEYIK